VEVTGYANQLAENKKSPKGGKPLGLVERWLFLGGSVESNLAEGEFEALQCIDQLGGIDRFYTQPMKHQGELGLPEEFA
jgi:hypothetical protein